MQNEWKATIVLQALMQCVVVRSERYYLRNNKYTQIKIKLYLTMTSLITSVDDEEMYLNMKDRVTC